MRIDCSKDNWENVLQDAVQEGKEAELVNFDYPTNGQRCETLAISHALHFVLDPKAKAGFLGKTV